MEMIKKIKEMRWTAKFISRLNKEDRANMLEAFNNRKQYYTPKIPGFGADLKDLQKCALCPDLCGFDAPCLLLSKDTTFSPQNKARVGYFMGMGLVPMENQSAISALYSCMTCEACKQWCPMDISAGDLMIQMRCELEKRDLIPENVQHLKTRVESNGSIFKDGPFSAESEFNIDMPKAKILYYIGCMSATNRKSMVRANIAILKHLGIPFTTKFEHRVCCGSPIYKVGYKSVAHELGERNRDLIRNSKVKLVVTGCPACMTMLKETYKSWGIKIKTPVIHIQDFILEKIEQGILKPSPVPPKSITYHDPCLLARGDGEGGPAVSRKILAALPGIQLKEAYLHGNETRCCGYGGGYHVTNTELSDKEGIIRLEQLRKHSPDYIVSACPTCEFALLEAQKNAPAQEIKDEVKDISELVAESLNLNI